MKGQKALITGGARGIGKEIALALAKQGVDIAISDVNEENLRLASIDIEKEGVKFITVLCDVSKSSDVSACVSKVIDGFGKIDILINNAGITKDALLLRMKDEDWDAVINVNLKGTFLFTREVIKHMTKERYGRIVNIASVVAFMGNSGQANYSASKAGIVGLTKTTALEYASRGITANAVAPGFIVTPMTDALSGKVKEEGAKSIPMGRMGTPEDVANAVLFLASKASGYITGNVIHVNGGMYM
ncbi:3-oxoacyl-[acyl-carrier protein] reductase [Candidatus Magnetoovum chiemensis]|nr:3-oxoacyl-[acyl-carrier protein] reductase [Candidatus Magnetoovum chiemensis]